jgi:HK97 family phage major capsid protein
MDGFASGVAAGASRQLRQLADVLDIPEHELRRYQLSRVLTELAEGRRIAQIGGVEFECHRECEIQSKAMGVSVPTLSPTGVLVPPSIFAERTSYTVGTSAAGGNLVAAVVQHDSVIDVLRPFMLAGLLGVTPDSGFVGNPVYQRITATSTPQEVAEGSAATESEATFDNVTAQPHTVTAWNKASRLFRQQIGESIVRLDIAKSLAVEIDKLVFTGSGASNQPTGLLNASGVGAVSGTATNFATLCSAEVGVLDANGLQDKRSAGWATCPDIASLLAQRYEDATTKVARLWQGSLHTGRVLGDVAYSSKLIPAQNLVYGDFSQIILPFYGAGIEIAVNENHNFITGDIAFRAMVSMDVIVRHAASFSVVSGIT